jgi:hypothetical protein
MNDDVDKGRKRQEKLAKDAERKRKQRMSYSEEKKEQIREHQREYQRGRRQNMSADEAGQVREQQREYQRGRRQNMSADEAGQVREQQREYQRVRRQNMSADEAGQVREHHREHQRVRRQNMSVNEVAEQRSLNLEHVRSHRSTRMQENAAQSHVGDASVIEHNIDVLDISAPILVDICSSVEKEACVRRCQDLIRRTLVTEEEVDYREGLVIHKSLVCVVCDCSITGRDAFHWISKDVLKANEFVLSYRYHYQDGINPVLLSQYTLSDRDLTGLLLSPRARRKTTDGSYMCCDQCYKPFSVGIRLSKPPKYAISNGFAIGHLPDEYATNLTPLVNNLVAPVRAFNYFISFNGGKEHKITGNFTFFAQDVSQNIGALQHISQTNNNPCVFIVLIGSFTQRQLDKIRTQGTYHVDTFRNVYSFLHANNDNYSTLPSIEDVPLPKVEQVRLNEADDIVEDSCNPNEEETVCWKYWFPATGDPDYIAGTYQNQSDFAKALISSFCFCDEFFDSKFLLYTKLQIELIKAA